VACCALLPAGLRAQSDDAAQRIARELTPVVERAVGVRFRRPPVVATRSREQVRRYLDGKIAEQFPPSEMRAVERAYKAFGLVPETLDVRRLLLDLYAEQVVGFYDPDSSALFVVRGADPMMVRLILAHELVHALQDQHTPLNRILKQRRSNDRQMAGQAVMEGQAVVASLAALAPGQQLPDLGEAWGMVREQIRQQQASMPVFAEAPLILQEGMLFPYLAGAEFVRGFESRRQRADEQPWGDRLPVSTEQILHPSKYTSGDQPARLTFAATAGDTVAYSDDFGQFETRVALQSWGLPEADAIAAAMGWDGDRYEVRGTRAGTVLLWAVAWDSPADAAEFERALRRAWERRTRSGYGAGRRWQVETLEIDGVKVVRFVDAPSAWTGWGALPAVRLTPPAP
jgi:hypothetical protein